MASTDLLAHRLFFLNDVMRNAFIPYVCRLLLVEKPCEGEQILQALVGMEGSEHGCPRDVVESSRAVDGDQRFAPVKLCERPGVRYLSQPDQALLQPDGP